MPKLSNHLAALAVQKGKIQFNQIQLLDSVKLKKYPKLKNLNLKFNGLCEVISNFVIINDVLGKNHPILSDTEKTQNLYIRYAYLTKVLKQLRKREIKFAKELAGNKQKQKKSTLSIFYSYQSNFEIQEIQKDAEITASQISGFKKELKKIKTKIQAKKYTLQGLIPTDNFLTNCITLKKLKQVENSHILNVSSFIELLKAYFFNIYPNSVFSNNEKIAQKNKHNDVIINKKKLKEKLENETLLPIGSYIKFFIFHKEFLSMSGHSMVIKKINNNQYSFFNPNKGEYYNLSFNELYLKLNKLIPKYNGTHIAFIHGQKYVKSLNPQQKATPDKKKSRSSHRKR